MLKYNDILNPVTIIVYEFWNYFIFIEISFIVCKVKKTQLNKNISNATALGMAKHAF